MRRSRLTITLRKDYLDQLDQLADGQRLRNRSHAIEYLIGKALNVSDVPALILAGGEGAALRPFTYELPKALLPIKGKPLLEHTLLALKKANVSEIILAIDYLGNKIEDYFGNGSKWGLKISYLRGEKSGGTAAAVRQARKILGDRSFLLHYGDVLAQIDYVDMLNAHQSHTGVGTMALTSVADVSEWGVVSLRGSRVLAFMEKPKNGNGASHVINAGMYLFNHQIFDLLTPKTKSLEKEIFPLLAREGKLFGYPFEGAWFDVGSQASYERAVKEWKE